MVDRKINLGWVSEEFVEIPADAPPWLKDAHARWVDVLLDALEGGSRDSIVEAKLQRREARHRAHVRDMMEHPENWRMAFWQGEVIRRTLARLAGHDQPQDGVNYERLLSDRGMRSFEVAKILRDTIRSERKRNQQA